MKAYVINLDRSPDRWAWVERHAAAAGVRLERLRAVDGAELSRFEVEAWKDAPFMNHTITPGEVACFLSHREAWGLIAAGDEPYGAVFEDDAHFGNGIADFLDSADWIPEGIDVVRLETYLLKVTYDRAPVATAHGRDIFRIRSSDKGTAGYIISRRLCKRLHSAIDRIGGPVDEILFGEKSPFHASITACQVDPALCVQDFRLVATRSSEEVLVESMLQAERHTMKPRGLGKVWREVRRPVLQARRVLIRLWRYSPSQVRRIVPFE